LRYQNFRIIARIIGGAAWLLGIFIFIYFLISAIEVGGAVGLAVGIGLGIALGAITFMLMYSFSQFIYVALDIERNTRAIVRAILEESEMEEEEEEEEELEEGETEEEETEEGE
jgi:hypothetical protein